ncbi:hypothetical protein U1Q18_000577 [Sarracenia purpurea var. burkii]
MSERNSTLRLVFFDSASKVISEEEITKDLGSESVQGRRSVFSEKEGFPTRFVSEESALCRKSPEEDLA